MKLDASVTIRDRIDDLYRSESRRVFASLVRLLKGFDLADDAMHEAYAAAVEIWQRDGLPANPRAWLIIAVRWRTSWRRTLSSVRRRRASIEGPTSRTPQGLLRVSIGLEHPDDLIDDLTAGFARLTA